MGQAEVRQLIDSVAEAFGTGVDAWLDCFADPIVLAAPDATQSLDHASARPVFEQLRNALRERGLDRTEVRAAEITMVGNDIALADCTFNRLCADGSLLEIMQAAYLCRRRNGRWLVVTLAPRAPIASDDRHE